MNYKPRNAVMEGRQVNYKPRNAGVEERQR